MAMSSAVNISSTQSTSCALVAPIRGRAIHSFDDQVVIDRKHDVWLAVRVKTMLGRKQIEIPKAYLWSVCLVACYLRFSARVFEISVVIVTWKTR